MEGDFRCEFCNYVATRSYDLKRHNKSTRHLQNKKAMTYKISEQEENVCNYCKQSFSSMFSLKRHLKHCELKKNEVYRLQNEIKNKDNELKNKDTEIKNKENELKYKELMLETKDKELESKEKLIETLLKGMTTVNLVNSMFDKAKPLVPMRSYRKIESYQLENTSNKNFLETMTSNYNDKTIHQFLGDFIIDNYKKPHTPHLQSMWSTDVTRINYLVRSLIGKKKRWTVDKKGIITKETVIDPLLKYIRGYLDDIPVKNITKEYSTLEAVNILNMITYTCDEIDKGFMAEKIIKYITPHFHIKKRSLLTYFHTDPKPEKPIKTRKTKRTRRSKRTRK